MEDFSCGLFLSDVGSFSRLLLLPNHTHLRFLSLCSQRRSFSFFLCVCVCLCVWPISRKTVDLFFLPESRRNDPTLWYLFSRPPGRLSIRSFVFPSFSTLTEVLRPRDGRRSAISFRLIVLWHFSN